MNNVSFECNYPAVVYEAEEGVYDAFSPPIPIKLDGETITETDIVKVGTYPDNVVKSLVRERDRKGMQLRNIKNDHEKMSKKMYQAEEKLKQQKGITKEHLRYRQMWQGKCALLEAREHENRAENIVEEEEEEEEDDNHLPNGHVV